jgi:hypothetical protein
MPKSLPSVSSVRVHSTLVRHSPESPSASFPGLGWPPPATCSSSQAPLVGWGFDLCTFHKPLGHGWTCWRWRGDLEEGWCGLGWENVTRGQGLPSGKAGSVCRGTGGTSGGEHPIATAGWLGFLQGMLRTGDMWKVLCRAKFLWDVQGWSWDSCWGGAGL